MKKKFIGFALVAIVAASGYVGYRTHALNSSASIAFQFTDVEALADCELVNGKLPNGYCRKDSYNNYFCGSPHWFYSDNCIQ